MDVWVGCSACEPGAGRVRLLLEQLHARRQLVDLRRQVIYLYDEYTEQDEGDDEEKTERENLFIENLPKVVLGNGYPKCSANVKSPLTIKRKSVR